MKTFYITFLITALFTLSINSQIVFSDPVTNPFPGFDGAYGASMAVDVNDINNVVERVAFEGAVGFPTPIAVHEEFINDGSATFTAGNLNPTPIFLSEAVYADFDNDGDKDYLIFGSLTALGDAPTVILFKKNTSS